MNTSRSEQSHSARLYYTAEQQSGYFTAAQASKAGFSPSLLTYHVHTGRFVRVKWGVYRLVQFPSSPHEDLYIAWLEAGPCTAISHDSALALHGLSDVLPARVHVTVPRNASRRHQRLSLHTIPLDPLDLTNVAGLPVTTVLRTLADVTASGLAEEQVILAVKQAIQRGLVGKIELVDYTLNRGGRLRRLVSQALQDLSA
ncbi:MAG: type IV toxin-antitoxin system AbiEi family antitoxin domain-containing protein [Anaerolineae bacterium]